jgi:hypothetical protein
MLQTAPLVDRYQYGNFDAASRHHLRPITEACIEKLTESRFRVPHLPSHEKTPL